MPRAREAKRELGKGGWARVQRSKPQEKGSKRIAKLQKDFSIMFILGEGDERFKELEEKEQKNNIRCLL